MFVHMSFSGPVIQKTDTLFTDDCAKNRLTVAMELPFPASEFIILFSLPGKTNLNFIKIEI